MFRKVLIANRGEIAARIIRTLQRLGIEAIGVASDSDRFTPPMLAADRVMRLGAGPVAATYLNVDAIIGACHDSGAQAVHPGYGFLSENTIFAGRLAAEGIAFIGPRPEHIRAFGLKHTARELAAKSGVPLLPGSGLLASLDQARAEAEKIGYPVMLKSTAGGGGIGILLCRDEAELARNFAGVAQLASGNFGDARLYLERFVAAARHVEVQIFGDGKGGIVTLGERDCSAQRRNQKVIEETPAPNLGPALRTQLRDAAIALGKAVQYESAGTVEFIYDVARDEVYFLEVNTRLQVEHPVTEEVFGVDLIEWMVRQAGGDFVLPQQSSLQACGHAIEVRVYAENPALDFRPGAGLITAVHFPSSARVESWIAPGTEISSFYDPLLAKLVVRGDDRATALAKLRAVLDECAVWGVETNLAYLRAITDLPVFEAGSITTATLKTLGFSPCSVDVQAPGAQSSLQDVPGRLGYWDVGIPPSGPMDERSHRLVNRLVGNAPGAAVLECTFTGPSLRFRHDGLIALGGADMEATLDGKHVPLWQAVPVKAGSVLALGRVAGAGMRTYLAVRGGFDAPLYLGSRSTFSLGGFGGHATGVLKAGDTLRIGREAVGAPEIIAADAFPVLTDAWDIGVLYGPHGAPDFFTEADIKALFAADYRVHFNSARTGVRLIGPTPQWARRDGGEAGLHPSNIHDNAYAVGAIDFTGDTPIILGPDGPSLGGFVCPATLAQGELWKLGQLKPGDTVRFRAVSLEDAAALKQGKTLAFHRGAPSGDVLRSLDAETAVRYRRAGDDNILVEYGPMALDFALRLKAHLLAGALADGGPPGIIDLTPGIRSLQVHYDNDRISEGKLLDALVEIERGLPSPQTVSVPSRVVHLPLSWNDEQAQLAMRRYQELVRPNAPWCPSNIEFIRRINGLDSIDDVQRIVFDASYLVLGLGDVYLGAPVATPLDPRHRLVTTKYNPARTWTPENAVGIGGAYLCVYGMEGPGGYQLFGRTIQMWNRWRATPDFQRPWLLRFFDQIRFYPVSAEELLEAREAFPYGRYPLRIEQDQFSLAAHQALLAPYAVDIARFKSRQQQAFEAERARWREQGLDAFVADDSGDADAGETTYPVGTTPVHAPISATVWKMMAAVGETVSAGDVLIIVESMKMEVTIAAPAAGVIREFLCQPGRTVKAGQVVALMGEG